MQPAPESPRSIRRIVLLEPQAPGLHIYSRFGLPRIGVVLLGTILRELGYEVSVMVEAVQPFDMDLVRQADLVGISVITPTAMRAYALADELRAGGQRVVLGGPHPTHMADEGLEHADYVVRGEGEEALPALLRALEGRGELAAVPNLSWRQHDVAVHNPLDALQADLDRFPTPDLGLVDGFGAMNLLGMRKIIPVQTSRGCPHDCSFCSVTSTFGRRMRYRSIERIRDELLRYDLDESMIFFYDDNFAASPKRAREVVSMIRSLPGKPHWSAQVRADIARDPALLEEMSAAGCIQFYLGLESVNQESLDGADKKQDLEQTREHIRRIHAAGIRVHGMFVFGFDTDTDGTLERTVAFARELALSTVQFLILTPLPGSRTYRELEAQGRLISRDWARYDAHHVNFQPVTVSPTELQRWQIEGHRRYYRLWPTLRRWSLRDLIVAIYAQRINKRWQVDNRDYMEWLEGVTGGPQLLDTAAK
jgi:radical SAM superfamily enzyme YgiQ (UPF0313 family)